MTSLGLVACAIAGESVTVGRVARAPSGRTGAHGGHKARPDARLNSTLSGDCAAPMSDDTTLRAFRPAANVFAMHVAHCRRGM